MHWIGFIAFAAVAMTAAVLAWALKTHSHNKELAQKKAKEAAANVQKQMDDLANRFLETVTEGEDPDAAAETLRTAAQSVIPGQHGEPTVQSVNQYAIGVRSAVIEASKRRTAVVIVGSVTGIATIALFASAVLYQFNKIAPSTASPAAAQRPPVQFARPYLKTN